MRVLFALSGLHRVHRGAELAFINIARGLASRGNAITLAGSGYASSGSPYEFVHVPARDRTLFEKYPHVPFFRDASTYEDFTFARHLLKWYKPKEYDVTVTCSYPYTNWVLRRPVLGSSRPLHIFVTQNGDWPAAAHKAEYRLFGCDGLVCINPDYYQRNKDRWNCALIPNGVNVQDFNSAIADRQRFGLPENRTIVLMVSALIPSKRVSAAIEVVSAIRDLHLVVAGDGPERSTILALAEHKLPGRFHNLTVRPEEMPALYKSADIFLHMATEESFGNVYVEALAAGIPIVAHNSQRTRWIVGDTAQLIDTNDRNLLIRTLQSLGSSAYPAPGESVGRARDFDWSQIAERYDTFFRAELDKVRHALR